MVHLYESSKMGKFMKTECTWVVARGWERSEWEGAAYWAQEYTLVEWECLRTRGGGGMTL